MFQYRGLIKHFVVAVSFLAVPLNLASAQSGSANPSSKNTPNAVTFSFSHDALHFDNVGSEQSAVTSIVVRPSAPGGQITKLLLTEKSAIRILSPDETRGRGGLPCLGLASIDRFCVIMVKLETKAVGVAITKLEIYGSTTPGVSGSRILTSIGIDGVVTKAPTVFPNRFTTISLRSVASKEGFANLRDYLQWNFGRIAPRQWIADDAKVFELDNYGPNSRYMNNWVNSVFKHDGHAWDAFQDGTAITQCHLILAAHFQRSGPIVFNALDGRRFESNVVASRNVTDADINIARIDPCLPKDWTIYPLLDGADALMVGENSHELEQVALPSHSFNFQDGVRRYSIGQLAGGNRDFMTGQYNPQLPEYLQYPVRQGDSGNPIFVWVGDRLAIVGSVAAGANTYAWTSYSYTSSRWQAGIREAIAALP